MRRRQLRERKDKGGGEKLKNGRIIMERTEQTERREKEV